MHFVPSLLGLFLSLPGVNQWRTLQRVPIGGEALSGELADKFHATSTRCCTTSTARPRR